jgi:hypothetical protein
MTEILRSAAAFELSINFISGGNFLLESWSALSSWLD